MMRHCIASYEDEIALGRAHAYRVLFSDERATLLIGLEKGAWKIRDCRGAANRQVSEATLERVGAWLDMAQAAEEAKPNPLNEYEDYLEF